MVMSLMNPGEPIYAAPTAVAPMLGVEPPDLPPDLSTVKKIAILNHGQPVRVPTSISHARMGLLTVLVDKKNQQPAEDTICMLSKRNTRRSVIFKLAPMAKGLVCGPPIIASPAAIAPTLSVDSVDDPSEVHERGYRSGLEYGMKIGRECERDNEQAAIQQTLQDAIRNAERSGDKAGAAALRRVADQLPNPSITAGRGDI